MKIFGKIIALIIWLFLVSSILYAIYHEQDLFHVKSQSVAKMTSKSGDILFREEGLVRWREAVENQEFADGDWVVTGPESISTITFRSGQVLKVGPDTQIQIRGIMQANSEYSYMVTLSKGAVIAEVSAKKTLDPKEDRHRQVMSFLSPRRVDADKSQHASTVSPGMVIRSGNRSFSVEEGKKIGLVKEKDSKEIAKISENVLKKPDFLRSRVSISNGLKADFLPPSARVFPDKIGSIVVAKEAVLLKTNLAAEIASGTTANESGKVSSEEESIREKGIHKEMEQPKISLADLTLISQSLSSSHVYSALDKGEEVSTSNNQSGLNNQKIRDNLPVLKLKDKIDKLYDGLDSSKSTLKSEAYRSGLKKVSKRNRMSSLDSNGNQLEAEFRNTSKNGLRLVNNSPKSIVSADGFEHRLQLDNRSLSIAVYKSVFSLRNGKVRLPLIPPKNKPLIGQLRPVVELIGKQGVAIPFVEGQSAGLLEVVVPLDLVIKYGRERVFGVFKEYEVSARAGSMLTVNGEKSLAFERVFSVIKVRGYAGGSSQGITIGLDRFDTEKSSKGLSIQKSEVHPDQAPLRISLQSGNDLGLMTPFIENANQVGFAKGGPRDDVGYFLVKNQTVIAEVSGAGLTRGVLEKIVTALRADFVFRGPKYALHESMDKNRGDLTSWVDSLLDQGKVLYVMKRAKLYPVSREFVKTNNEVAKFIDAQAKAVFVEKVDVIFFR